MEEDDRIDVVTVEERIDVGFAVRVYPFNVWWEDGNLYYEPAGEPYNVPKEKEE